MSFKSILNGGCLLGLLFFVVGCDVKIGEKPPEPQEIGLGVTKCLTKSANDLKLFFTAEVNDRDLAAAWGCVESVFFQFDKYVVGQDRDRYTSQEIVNFLQKNFFESQSQSEITPAFQKELMKLKQIFVGGSVEFVTRDELKKSQLFIRNISQMTVELNQYMKIIIMNWVPNVTQSQSSELELFEKSNLAAQVFVKKLSAIIKSNDSVYKISDAIQLAREFEKFFNEEWEWIEEVEQLVPAAQKMKKSLAGGDENLIKNNEWPPVLTLLARGYYQYLRYFYFIKSVHETGGGIRLVYVARTMEDIFSTFQDLLIEKESKAITQKELFEILKAFESAWPDFRISDELIQQFMKLKKLLVGGNSDGITAGDFENARLKVPELKRIVESFLSYYSIYSFEWEPELDGVERSRKLFEEARSRLYVVGQDISRFLQGSYSFEDLIQLVEEFERLYPDESFQTYSARRSLKADLKSVDRLSNGLRKYEPFIKQANQVLFGRLDTVIEEKNWVVVIPMVARFYSLFQYFDYFIVDKNLKQTQPLVDLGVLVDHSLILVEDALGPKAEKRFSDDELNSLVNAAVEADFLPKSLTQATVQKVIQALLQNVLFDPSRRLQGEVNRFLSVEQIQILKTEFKGWLDTQLILNKIFNDDPQLALAPSDLINSIRDQISIVRNNNELLEGLKEVEAVLNSNITRTLDPESQLQISNRQNWQYFVNAAFQVNLNRVLTRVLIRAFSSEASLTRVSECDTEIGFGLLVGIFRDLGIFNPSETFISSRFLEANIFMPRADGDKFLNYFELSELVGVIFSGLNVNSKLENSIRKVCPVLKDKAGKEFTSFKCLSEHHYVAVRKYMTQLPEFKSFVDKLASRDRKDINRNDNPGDYLEISSRPGFADWNLIFRAAFKATGWEPNNGYGDSKLESVYFSDMIYYPFVIHYLEYVFARFDTTKNGALQVFEARQAFPIFRPLLKELAQDQLNSGTIKESDLLAVFTYILKYKEQPSASDLGAIWRWLTWKSNPDSWDLWVTRSEMSQILGYIADQASGLKGKGKGQALSCQAN